MKTKSISYAHPYSPNAARFGFLKTGCYVLETINGCCNPPILVSAHASKEAAIQAGESLTELPWNKYSLNVYQSLPSDWPHVADRSY